MQDAQAQGDNPAVLLAQYKISNLKHRIGQWPLPYWEPKDFSPRRLKPTSGDFAVVLACPAVLESPSINPIGYFFGGIVAAFVRIVVFVRSIVHSRRR